MMNHTAHDCACVCSCAFAINRRAVNKKRGAIESVSPPRVSIFAFGQKSGAASMLPSFMAVLPRDVIDAHVFATLTCADLVHLAMVNVATYNAMRGSALSDYGATRLALVGLCRAVRRYVYEWLTELLLYIPIRWDVVIAIKSSGVAAAPTMYVVRRSSSRSCACLCVWQAVVCGGGGGDDDIDVYHMSTFGSVALVGSTSFSDDDDVHSTRIDAVRALIDKALQRSNTASTISLVASPYLPPGCVPSTTYKHSVDALDARQRWLLCPYSAFLAADTTTTTFESFELVDAYSHFAGLWMAAAAAASSSPIERMEASSSSSTSKRRWRDFIGGVTAPIVSESDNQMIQCGECGADVLRLILTRGDRDSLRDARFEWINESLATCAVTASRVLSNVAPPTPFHDVETDSLIRRLVYAEVMRARVNRKQ